MSTQAPQEGPVSYRPTEREADEQRYWSPLMIAAYRSDMWRVAELVAQGNDVNAVERQHYQTALMAAAYGGKTAMVTELVRLGADVAIKDKEGRDVLHPYYRDKMSRQTAAAVPVVSVPVGLGTTLPVMDQPVLPPDSPTPSSESEPTTRGTPLSG